MGNSISLLLVVSVVVHVQSFRLSGFRRHFQTNLADRQLKSSPLSDLPKSDPSTKEEFFKVYPKYLYNPHKKLIAPPLRPEALTELMSGLAPKVVESAKLMARNLFSSRHPLVYELVKYLVSMTDLQILPQQNRANINVAQIALAASEFAMDHEDLVKYANIEDVILRWEDWFRGYNRNGVDVGFSAHALIDYSVGSPSGIHKQIVLVTNKLKARESLVSHVDGFWRACSAGARACESNIATLIDHHKLKGMSRACTGMPCDFNQCALDGSAEALSMPVFVAMTDWTNWIFLKIENYEISASPILSPFPDAYQGMYLMPDILTVVQFLCTALNITERVDRQDNNSTLVERFVAGAFGTCLSKIF